MKNKKNIKKQEVKTTIGVSATLLFDCRKNYTTHVSYLVSSIKDSESKMEKALVQESIKNRKSSLEQGMALKIVDCKIDFAGDSIPCISLLNLFNLINPP